MSASSRELRCRWRLDLKCFVWASALCGKGLVVRDKRSGFCEKLPEASPISDGANATGSKMDPPRGTNLPAPGSVQKEREEVLQALEQRFPVARGEAHGEASCVAAAHGGA